MLGRQKKGGFLLKVRLFFLRWYPSSRGCISMGNHRHPPQLMPPLMVRKPEWRR
ncbi:MAG: hypothetical protein MUC88_27170 [Planctomycetes bacterium]|jgi:hypothetical protein|nr:hypothetical protein [Planctomycetota bacterium]